MPFTDEDKVLIKHYRLTKGYGRKKLLKEFPEKNWSKTGLQKLLKKIGKTGDIKRKQGSGRPRTSRLDANIEAVEDMVLSQENEPGTHLSLREIESETGIPLTSVHRIVHEDLGLTAFKLTNVQRLTVADEKKRLDKGKRILHKLRLNRDLNKTFFTDEKIFKLQAPNNKQNDRVYGVNLSDIREKGHSEKSKFPSTVMVSAGISKLGKTSIHFVTPGAKINSAYYCNEVLSQLLPEMERLSNGDYIFQQDGARSHTSKATLAYLEEHCCQFLKPDLWPPNSPDLNPCDYAIWGTLEARIWNHNRFNIKTIEDLKERIVEEWDALPQEMIDKSIDSFRKRVRMLIQQNGGHIEKYI